MIKFPGEWEVMKFVAAELGFIVWNHSNSILDTMSAKMLF